ncbi:hypothetical protein [Porphyromonas gulae]|uniref:hypothetical protein n=1 Tax=Porphyromonas gulae TaxID=111105 RepID=UPI001F45C008|nr:hypothetical protein [Porphyromonas gulae]
MIINRIDNYGRRISDQNEKLRSHPLNRSLISDIQQISLRISLLNLQVFLSS